MVKIILKYEKELSKASDRGSESECVPAADALVVPTGMTTRIKSLRVEHKKIALTQPSQRYSSFFILLVGVPPL